MMERNDISHIAKQLLDRSLRNEVNWLPGSNPLSSCEVVLKTTLMEVARNRKIPSEETLSLRIFRTDPDIASALYVPVGELELPVVAINDPTHRDHLDARLLCELYDIASKSAFHLDDVLEEIQKALNASEIVGIREPVHS
jgi:hypothetical protein